MGRASRVVRLALLFGFCSTPCMAGSAAIRLQAAYRDDFSAYAEGARPDRTWEFTGIGWRVQAGQLVSGGIGHTFALPAAAPHARAMTFSAVITPRQAPTGEWKTAGIAVYRADGSYWHLALVEKPDSQGRGHGIELTEMLAGRWLANYESPTQLRVTADRGMELNWQYGRPYRLTLALSPEGLVGTVHDANGAEVARKGYAFDREAVTTGRPALTTSGLAAAFDGAAVTVSEPAPPPRRRAVPPYSARAMGPRAGRRTGFFHVEQQKGRWWLVDPNGCLFYAVGTDHVNYNAHWCEKLGYAPYHRNVAARYGGETRWAEVATTRLKQWGFNTLGAGCIPSTYHRGLAHTLFLSLGAGFTSVSDIAPRTTWTGFPDVFHPEFAAWCDAEAQRQCAPNRDDPWVLGYFLDNELEWFGKDGSATGLVGECFRKPAGHPAKEALVAFLRTRYHDVASLNRAWGTAAASYEGLAASTQPLVTSTARGQRDRTDFVRLIAERYFAITTAAVRKADPNHMVLGCRFAGYAPDVWDVAGRHLDIVSVNFYGQVDLERGQTPDMPATMRRYQAPARRPLMLTEWSFPALDAGLPSAHGAGQRVATQHDKARCYSIYQRALFALPFMVGSDYFMWVDEPALGISSTFPEDSNYGLVDVNDRPWADLVRTASRVNREAYRLHAADTADLRVSVSDADGTGRIAHVVVWNRGRRGARFALRTWVQGSRRDSRVSLAPGQSHTRSIPVTGAAFVAAQVDPSESVLQADRGHTYASRLFMPRRPAAPGIVVVNSSGSPVDRVPVTAALGSLGPGWQVLDTAGRPMVSQIDVLPSGPELTLVLPRVGARSAATFQLRRAAASPTHEVSGGDRDVALPGPLPKQHRRGSGHLFDSVSLGNLPLGRYGVLVNQTGGQPLWVPPDRVERIRAWQGPVRSVVLFTAALGSPAAATVTTAVGDGGTYAQQERRPGAYRTTFRLDCPAGEPWFSSRFMMLANTDTVPWTFQSYYHYPVSAIGGAAEDDRAGGTPAIPTWSDSSARACYGAVINTDRMKATFWKDTPDGASEHADIWREVRRTLAPGQVYRAAPDEPAVLVFGAPSTGGQADRAVLGRLKALTDIRAILVTRSRGQGGRGGH